MAKKYKRKPNSIERATRRQQEFLDARTEGRTLQQIADIFGVTKQYVWHRLRGIAPREVKQKKNCKICGRQFSTSSKHNIVRCRKCRDFGPDAALCACGELKTTKAKKCRKCYDADRCPDAQCVECIRIMYDAGIPMNLIGRTIRIDEVAVWRYVHKLCVVTRRQGEHTSWDYQHAKEFLQNLLSAKGWTLKPNYFA